MVNRFIIITVMWSSLVLGNLPTDPIFWFGSAQSSAIGQAATAQTNAPHSIFFNPAALNTNQYSSLSTSYSELYNTNISNVNAVSRFKNMSFGVGIHSTQSPNIDQSKFDETEQKVIITGNYNYSYSALFISTAMKLPYTSLGHIGTSFHIHRMTIANQTLQGQSINAGVLLQPLSMVSIGFVHHHIVPLNLTWKSNNIMSSYALSNQHKLESYSRAGIELTALSLPMLTWKLLADYEINQNQSSDDTNESPLKVGSIVAISPIELAVGYNARFISMGVSTTLGQLQLNYSFITPNNKATFQDRHAVGISIFF
ncbi:MAG: hypothetical protein ISQ13_02585 [Candidatus Margulisbacteria bacterium]|nr:hypothetical protein [Candidatus Margulisiibacteriota bacterium]